MRARVLRDDLVFAEGLRLREGLLWLSDMHAHEVLALDEAGDVRHRWPFPGRPSGLGWLPDGSLLAVSMLDHRLLRREGAGWVEHADLGGLARHQSNDLLVDGAGRAWVGSFGFDPFRVGHPIVPAPVVRVDPDGAVHLAADGLRFPNGMVVHDGRLIVAETAGLCLTAFDLLPDATLGPPRCFAAVDGLPDGIALADDAGSTAGSVWVALARTGPLDRLGPGALIRVAEGGEVLDRLDLGPLDGVACAASGDRVVVSAAVHSDPARIAGRGNGRLLVVEPGG